MRRPRKVLHLAREDDDGDSARESGDEWCRHELDDGTQARESHHEQHEAGHEGRDREPLDPVLLHDAVDDHDERARGPADLYSRTAQGGNQEPGDDRGDQAAFGRHAAGNGERDGERQGDNANDHARRQVVRELLLVVVP
jgi:hypothetical protein